MRRPRMLGGEAIVLVVVVSMALVAGCGSGDRDDPVGRPRPSTVGTAHDDPPAPESAGGPALLPGMPPPLDPGDVYAADRPGMLSAAVRGDPALVYVPNSQSNTVDAIDQRTYRIIRQFPTGAEPQHVTPSWDLRRLWVGNDQGNSLTPINPRTGCTPAGTPGPCTSPTVPPGRSRCCRSPPARSWRPGTCAGAARTWAGSRPTGRSCGCRAATTARSTRSTPAAVACWPASPSAPGRTACASIPSRAATRSATPGSFADGWRATPGHPRDHGAVVPAAGRLLQLPWRPAHADQTGGHPPPYRPDRHGGTGGRRADLRPPRQAAGDAGPRGRPVHHEHAHRLQPLTRQSTIRSRR